jgi:hypothetical protein
MGNVSSYFTAPSAEPSRKTVSILAKKQSVASPYKKQSGSPIKRAALSNSPTRKRARPVYASESSEDETVVASPVKKAARVVLPKVSKVKVFIRLVLW